MTEFSVLVISLTRNTDIKWAIEHLTTVFLFFIKRDLFGEGNYFLCSLCEIIPVHYPFFGGLKWSSHVVLRTLGGVLFESHIFTSFTLRQRMSTKSLNHVVFIWIIFIQLGIMKDWTSVIVEVLFFCICVILRALRKMCRLSAKKKLSVVSSGLVGCFVIQLASVSVCVFAFKTHQAMFWCVYVDGNECISVFIQC